MERIGADYIRGRKPEIRPVVATGAQESAGGVFPDPNPGTLWPMSDATPQPDFHGIYLDTNVLKGNGWPVPSILLANLLRLARWWKIKVFIPDPVLREAEEHWLRSVKDGESRLQNAKRECERLAGPFKFEVTVAHTPITQLLEEYRRKVGETAKDFGYEQSPFTRRTVSEVFEFATKYLMPFKPDGKGSGFQDAVILLSVLDHLNSLTNAPRAILITADKAFSNANFNDFVHGFDPKRLRVVVDLEKAFDSLWEPYFDETAIKPYRQEVQNALSASKILIPEITAFLKTHLTEEMIKATQLGDTVIKILSVNNVQVLNVEVPFSGSPERTRVVEILMRVSAECKVIAKRDFAWMYGFLKWEGTPPPPREVEDSVYWSGDIEATAEIVNTEFKNIKLKALASSKAPT